MQIIANAVSDEFEDVRSLDIILDSLPTVLAALLMATATERAY